MSSLGAVCSGPHIRIHGVNYMLCPRDANDLRVYSIQPINIIFTMGPHTVPVDYADCPGGSAIDLISIDQFLFKSGGTLISADIVYKLNMRTMQFSVLPPR